MKGAVLITGANRGLGFSLAARFADTHRLVLHCRSVNSLPEGPEAAAEIIYANLAKPVELSGFCEQVRSIDDLTVLVNNAANYLNWGFDTMSRSDLKESINVNLVAPMLLTSAAWPALTRNHGVVVNINSVASSGGGPGESAYAASKAGLRGFSDTIQYDATKAGISVINVTLGAMLTRMTNGRKDQPKYIDPDEVAVLLHTLCCADFQTLRVTNLDIKRRLY